LPRALLVALCALLWGVPANAIDKIVLEELKEQAIQYGKISQRFQTCKVKPPASIRAAFLRYARHKGASDGQLDLLSKLFSEGEARVQNLRTGFSPEECKQKLESPEGQKLLQAIEKWYNAPDPKGS
jgi:hypothetical protein